MTYYYELFKIGKRLTNKIASNRHFSKPFDIWKDEISKVSTEGLEEIYVGVHIQSTGGMDRKFVLRFFELNPTHTNHMTRFYLDDFYCAESLSSVSHKRRVDMMKYVQKEFLSIIPIR